MKENPDKGYLKAVATILSTDGNAIVRTRDIKTFLKKLDVVCGIKAVSVHANLPENQSYIVKVEQN
jgi:hypothetical protein